MTIATEYLAAAIAYRFYREGNDFSFPSNFSEMLLNINKYYGINLGSDHLEKALLYLHINRFITYEQDRYAGTMLFADQDVIDENYKQFADDVERPAFRPLAASASDFYHSAVKNPQLLTDLDSERILEDPQQEGNRARSISVPASDRIVTILHNSVEGVELVESLDNVIEDLQANNAVASLAGEDRSRLLSEAKASKELISSETVRSSVMMQLLWKFFKELSVKFRDKASDWGVERAIALLDKLMEMVK